MGGSARARARARPRPRRRRRRRLCSPCAAWPRCGCWPRRDPIKTQPMAAALARARRQGDASSERLARRARAAGAQGVCCTTWAPCGRAGAGPGVHIRRRGPLPRGGIPRTCRTRRCSAAGRRTTRRSTARHHGALPHVPNEMVREQLGRGSSWCTPSTCCWLYR